LLAPVIAFILAGRSSPAKRAVNRQTAQFLSTAPRLASTLQAPAHQRKAGYNPDFAMEWIRPLV